MSPIVEALDLDILYFYDHLSAHSLLAKLGRVTGTLDTSKILHRNKTRSTGSGAKDLIPNFAFIGPIVEAKLNTPISILSLPNRARSY